MSKEQEALELYNEALNSPNKEKLLKKAIKLDSNNLDIRLAYINTIEKPKKKINEYDCLVTEEIRKIAKNDPELEDLKRLLYVSKIYIKEAFELGFDDEAIECGLSCLRLNKNDDYKIRFMLTNHIFRLNRLHIYHNYYQEFEELNDLLSDLIFSAITENLDMFKKTYEFIMNINPNLIDLLNDKQLGDSKLELEAKESYNLYKESVDLIKNNINEYLKAL